MIYVKLPKQKKLAHLYYSLIEFVVISLYAATSKINRVVTIPPKMITAYNLSMKYLQTMNCKNLKKLLTACTRYI